ncbi:MAG: MarR family winged helix-turn-helix transcriptional regulator [Firmicutes bacterium]|nr:MarR family winged helix-turn-helix transcriptional regulator [Bacillota bacterium]
MNKAEAAKFCDEHCGSIPGFMQTFMQVWSGLYKDISLGHHQAGLLVFIDCRGQCKMSDLAAELSISPGAITQLVDSLVMQGLLERTNDSKDRRVVLVNLTRKAQNMVEIIKHRRKALMEGLFSSLSKEEALSLIAIIGKLEQTLKDLDINGLVRVTNTASH